MIDLWKFGALKRCGSSRTSLVWLLPQQIECDEGRVRRLEDDLRGELKDAAATGAGYGAPSCAGGTVRRVGVAKLWIIQCVECVHAEPNGADLTNLELPEK